MLVLNRKREEKVQIGPDITITILRIKGRAVKIGIEAPEGVRVIRSELLGKPSAAPSDEPPAVDARQRPVASPGGPAPGDPARGSIPSNHPAASLDPGRAGRGGPWRRAPRADVAPQESFTLRVGPALVTPPAQAAGPWT